MAEPIYILTNSPWGFPILQILADSCYFFVFLVIAFLGYEVISHCGFGLCFSDDLWC